MCSLQSIARFSKSKILLNTFSSICQWPRFQTQARTLTEENTEADSITMTNAKSFDISMEAEGEKGVKIEGGFSSSHAWTKENTEETANTIESSISGTVLLL